MASLPVAAKDLLDRCPPSDEQAERWVIGSCVIDPTSIDRLAGWLDEEAFYVLANRTIYGTLKAMRDTREAIDIGLLVRRLQANSQIEAVGGVAYLAEVVQAIPHSAHAEYYGRIVLEHWRRRQMIHAATESLRDAYAAERPAEEVLAEAEERLRLVKTGRYDRKLGTWQDALIEANERIQAVMDRRVSVGLLTGSAQFDQDIGGLFGGELFVIAARPGIGKTALASQWAQYVASRGHRTYFASLEMSRLELATRCLCSAADVSSKKIRTGHLDIADMRAFAIASNEIANTNLVIDDRPTMTVADIARGVRQAGDVRLVVVDYLQRVTVANQKANRYVQVAEIAAGLKTIAREFDAAVLCLSSASRELDDDPDPKLRHVRESADIEHEADVVGFLIRPARWNKDDAVNESHAALVIRKNRNGERGTIKLRWEASRTRFVEPEACDFANYDPALGQYGGDFQ